MNSDPGPGTCLPENPEDEGGVPERDLAAPRGATASVNRPGVISERLPRDSSDMHCGTYALQAGSRRAAVTRARDEIAYLWVEVLGQPGRPLGSVLGVRPQAGCQAVMRGPWEGRGGSRSCRHNLSFLAGSPLLAGPSRGCSRQSARRGSSPSRLRLIRRPVRRAG